MAKKYTADDEMEHGDIALALISNTNSPLQTKKKIGFFLQIKGIFRDCLVEMKPEYQAALLFNSNHKVMFLYRNNKELKVVAALCYRPFPECGLIELVFLGVDPLHQSRGYGYLIMSAFQQYIADREENLKNIVTYADNKAVDFFKMNKFEPKRLDQKYRGYVKHYNKSLLMMHTIGSEKYSDYHLEGEDYMEAEETFHPDIFNDEPLGDDLHLVNSSEKLHCPKYYDLLMRETLRETKRKSNLKPKPDTLQVKNVAPKALLKRRFLLLIERLKENSYSSFFRTPVELSRGSLFLQYSKYFYFTAPNYYTIITSPMDLETLETNVNAGRYKKVLSFVKDVRLIFSNCYHYNDEDSIFYFYGHQLNKFYNTIAPRIFESFKGDVKIKLRVQCPLKKYPKAECVF
ncbi:bromodomain-containing protein [Ditylenchus destructor]|uniref:histone acetyltransferase n=1 Tax=Ditylenchus destructor TaxID=166010 RepID=A0AAD4R963_9BILA|nr:bromodomain-containing protein [Ditylenchus destructor]